MPPHCMRPQGKVGRRISTLKTGYCIRLLVKWRGEDMWVCEGVWVQGEDRKRQKERKKKKREKKRIGVVKGNLMYKKKYT